MAVSYPYLLRFKEKHGEQFFHISTKQDYVDALRTMFKQRDNEGYWYHHEMIDVSALPQPVNLDPIADDILELVREDLERKNLATQRAIIVAMRDNALTHLYEQAKAGDEQSLVEYMQVRRDYEYEEFFDERYSNLDP